MRWRDPPAPVNVLLDLDGTLTDPFEGIAGCVVHALRGLGVEPPGEDALREWIGPPLADSFSGLLGADDPGRIDEAVRLYRERFAEVGLFENTLIPGIPAALSAMRASGATLFLATSKPRLYAARIIDHFGLGRHLRAVHGSELDGTRAHKGALVAHILQAESLDAAATVMVGDRRHDIAGAAANGVRTIGVTWGYGSREELERAGASGLCHEPAALPAMIASTLACPAPSGTPR